MSISIIVATHGNASKELIHSAEMIVGKQENIIGLCFNFGDNIDDLHLAIENHLNQRLDNDECLILVDLKGGSPFNVSSQFALKENNIEVVSGVNLPLLIDAILSRDSLNLSELTKSVIENGKNGIEKLEKNISKEDDDF